VLRNTPIRQKVNTVILVTSSAVLLLTTASFFAYDLLTFRQTTIEQLSTVGEIVAANSTAALAFDDSAAASEILVGLRADPHIERAGIYDASGRIFASYPAALSRDALPSEPGTAGYRFRETHIEGYQPIMMGDRQLGVLYLRYGMGLMRQRLRLYGIIALLVIGVSLILAYLLSRVLQNQITNPVLSLAETAKIVSEKRDYTLRASVHGNDEVGELTKAFNQMLRRIQEQIARLDLLNRMTHAIGDRQNLASIFQVLVERLERDFPLDLALVVRLDNDAEDFHVDAVGDRGAAAAALAKLPQGTRLPLDQEPLRSCVHGETVHVTGEIAPKQAIPRRLVDAGLASIVMAPIAVEDLTFGVLVAARRENDAFSQADVDFLNQLSQHVGLAVNQVQLYEALQGAYDELRQTQQAAMQQERLRALGQMASGIAHDINNAISPIALYTESLLETEDALSDKSRRYLRTIQHAIEDVASTVSRVREFYRNREDQLALIPVALPQLVEQSLDLTHARWNDMPQQRGITINVELDVDKNVPVVRGIESDIRDALTNLIFNAVDAMPDGGELRLSVRHRDGHVSGGDVASRPHVVVRVTDTGIGMDDETRRRCLEPFYTTKGDRGTGLGLAMVYGMVQRHGGEIDVQSTPGEGTSISLLFPISGGLVPVLLRKARMRLSTSVSAFSRSTTTRCF
jgi:signal transduction histidine kinase/HAMP domain-containing protein